MALPNINTNGTTLRDVLDETYTIAPTENTIRESLRDVLDETYTIAPTENTIRENIRINTNSGGSEELIKIMEYMADQLREAGRSSVSERVTQLRTADFMEDYIKTRISDSEERKLAMSTYIQAIGAMKQVTGTFETITDSLAKNLGNISGIFSAVFTDLPPIFSVIGTRAGDFLSQKYEERKTKKERARNLDEEIGRAIFERSNKEIIEQEVFSGSQRPQEMASFENPSVFPFWEDNQDIIQSSPYTQDTRKIESLIEQVNKSIEDKSNDIITAINSTVKPEETYGSSVFDNTKEDNLVDSVVKEGGPQESKENEGLLGLIGMFGMLGSVFQRIIGLGKLVGVALAPVISSVFSLKGAIVALGIAITGLVSYFWDDISDFVSNAYDRIKDAVPDIIDWLGEKITSMFNWIGDAVISYYQGMWNIIKSFIPDFVLDWMGDTPKEESGWFSFEKDEKKHVSEAEGTQTAMNTLSSVSQNNIEKTFLESLLGTKNSESFGVSSEDIDGKVVVNFLTTEKDKLSIQRAISEGKEKEYVQEMMNRISVSKEDKITEIEGSLAKTYDTQSKTEKLIKNITTKEVPSGNDYQRNNTTTIASSQPITIINNNNSSVNNTTKKNIVLADPYGALAAGGFR